MREGDIPSPAARRSRLWTCAALAGAVVCVYARALGNDFVGLDDNLYVTENPRVREGLSLTNLGWAFISMEAYNWHPLTWLSHMLDVELYGLTASGHHATSVVLHAASAVLIFLALERASGALGPSAFAAGLFALHPLHVESVAWVAERKDVLSTALWALSLLAYLGWVARGGAPRYALSLALFAAALLAKPMVVTLPVLLLLLDFWPLGRARSWSLLLEKLPFFGLAAGASALALLAQAGAIQDSVPLWFRLANAAVATVGYAVSAVWPSGLAPLYPYPASLPTARLAGAATALLLVSAAALRLARRVPYLAVGWLWFLVGLLPVSGLVQVGYHAMADRYTYVPAIGLFLVAGFGGRDLGNALRLPRIARGALAGGLLLACAALSWRQLGYWRDTLTLFERAAAVTESNWVALTEVGMARMARGDLPGAERALEQALALQPRNARALGNLGYFDLRRGELERAQRRLGQALALDPRLRRAHLFRGIALQARGRLDAAASDYGAAIALDPTDAEALRRLALIRAADPDPAGRDAPLAIRLAEEACRLTANSEPAALDALAAAYAEAGRFDDALRVSRSALEIAQSRALGELAAELAARTRLYESGSPFRLPVASRSR